MGLAESQRLLAGLSTDATLRARFAEDPESVAAEFGLTTAESSAFEAILPDSITRFAGSLIRKRRGEVEFLLPLTLRGLGPGRFAGLFHRHASQFVPAGIKKHRDDAVAFANFLAEEVAEPAWIGDLARFEAASMIAHDPGRRWTFLRLQYHPADLARAAVDIPIFPRPSLVIWWRAFSKNRLRRVILSRPFK
jgi:hypothetical protein